METKRNLEESLKRMETIAKTLEEGCDLDTSITLYKEGIELANGCVSMLEEAKGKIMEIKNGQEEKYND